MSTKTERASRYQKVDLVENLKVKGYTEINEFTQETGAQKECFTAKDPLGRPVFITRDKTPTTRAAEILSSKGLSSENEARIAKRIPLDEAILHGVNPIMDSINYDGSVVNVWPNFENSMSLKKWVNEKGPLNKHQFRSTFTQYAESERFLFEDLNMLHRDPNPGNLLLRYKKRGQELEARIIDLGTTIENGADSISPITTGPARSIRDPTIDRIFSGQERKYDEKSEVYAIGMNAIYAITGDFPIYYDFIKGVAFSGAEDLLNEDGTLNKTKHQKALDKALTKFPKWAKKHVSWIRKATNLEPENRPSIIALNEEIKESCQPTLLERISSIKTKTKVAIAAGLVGLTALGGFATDRLYKEHKAEIKEASKFEVTKDWDGWHSKLSNPLFDMNVHAYGNITNMYPSEGFTEIEPGKDVHIGVTASGRKDFDYPLMPGRMYLEGVPTNEVPITEFSVWPNQKSSAPSEHYWYGGDRDIKIPKNFKPGTYILAVELLSPEIGNNSKNFDNNRLTNHLAHVKYPNKIISRERIPIVVGHPEKKVSLATCFIEGYSGDRLSFKDLEESKDFRYDSYSSPRGAKFTYEMSIPEENYYQTNDNDYINLWLPNGTNTQTRVLNLVTKMDGKVINYTGIPVERFYEPGYGKHTWRLANPTMDMPQKMIEFKTQYDKKDKSLLSYSLPSEKTSK